MEKCQFSEDNFKYLFIDELRDYVNDIPFLPTLAAETFLGFDVGLSLRSGNPLSPKIGHPKFCHLMRLFRWLLCRRIKPSSGTNGGVSLEAINRIATDLSKYKGWPKAHFDFYIQFKRANYYPRGSKAARKAWNGKGHYRFNIDKAQNEVLALNYLGAPTGVEAIYAAPAFHTWSDLRGHGVCGNIIQNSNIVDIQHMFRNWPKVNQSNSHSEYTFDKPGNSGIGFSDPAQIGSASLEEIIARQRDAKAKPFFRHMKETASAIRKSLEEANKDAEPHRQKALQMFKQQEQAILRTFYKNGEAVKQDEQSKNSFAHACVTIAAYSRAFNVDIVAMS